MSYNDHINNRGDAAFSALCLMVMLHMFRAPLAHHQEFKETVFAARCRIQLFLIMSVASPQLTTHTIKRTTIAHHSRTHETLHRYSTSQTKDIIKNNWIRHLAANTVSWTPDDKRVTLETCGALPSNKEHKKAATRRYLYYHFIFCWFMAYFMPKVKYCNVLNDVKISIFCVKIWEILRLFTAILMSMRHAQWKFYIKQV